ncbi:MAG: hypothetical protein P9M15_00870 [Candidatus Electryoneaceae bacterium]|nr:hypothetical protein [Candidatus Electryoneaceae bacterium]
MKIEIFKGGRWRRLVRPVGSDCVVRNRLQNDRLFGFVPPVATLQIFAEKQYSDFQPGEKWAITRGDHIRIYMGEPTLVKVFEGSVDRDISWTPKTGVLAFKALGWMAELKNVKVGQGQISDGHGGYDRYRYTKTAPVEVEDDDGQMTQTNYEYMVDPEVFEELWANRPGTKIGYRSIYLFDSRGLLYSLRDGRYRIEKREAQRDYEIVAVAGQYIHRRTSDGGVYAQVALENIAGEIVEQIHDWMGDKAYSLVFNPGQITGGLNVTVSELFDDIDLFSRVVNNKSRLFCVGWKGEDDETQIAELVNKTTWQQVTPDPLTWEFSRESVQATLNSNSENDYQEIGLRRNWRIVDDEIIYRARQVRYADEWVIIYKLWSWVEVSEFYEVNGGYIDDYYQTRLLLEWFVINLTGLNAPRHYTFSYDLIPRSTARGGDRLVPYRSAFITLGTDVVNQRPEASTEEAEDNHRELEFEGSKYDFLDSVLIVAGDIAMDSMSFRFEDVSAVDILYEIVKLTNSILYVDSDKKIYIVGRNYYGTVHTLDGSAPKEVRQGRSSYWNDRVPQLSSKIITNDSHLAAIRHHYSIYLPLEEENWELNYGIPTTELCRICLLDATRFDRLEGGEPAIVREMTLKPNSVTIKATRGV